MENYRYIYGSAVFINIYEYLSTAISRSFRYISAIFPRTYMIYPLPSTHKVSNLLSFIAKLYDSIGLVSGCIPSWGFD